VVEALSGDHNSSVDGASLANVLKLLARRWFVLRNVHQAPPLVLLQSRTTLSWLKGPMTRGDLKRLVAEVDGNDGLASQTTVPSKLRMLTGV
jgi:hypothetical protein